MSDQPQKTPTRVRRQRIRGWRMPTGAVYVGRPTRWGNPYFPGSGLSRGFFDESMRPAQYDIREPRVQVLWFRERMADFRRDQPDDFIHFIEPLKGRDLVCWCPLDQPCHADVLLEIANGPVRGED